MSYTSWIEAVKSVGSGEKHEPGDVWQTDAGWVGKRPDGSTQYGMKGKEKAQAYVAGKDVEVDEPEKEPKAEPEKEPTTSKLSDEEKTRLRDNDHDIADQQLKYNKKEMEEVVEQAKFTEAYSAEILEGSEKEIVGNIKIPTKHQGKPVVIPNAEETKKNKEELEKIYNGQERDGKYYPRMNDIKKAVKTYRDDHNLPSAGVGAGTAESRAGEVGTHKALRMLAGGASEEEVRAELMKHAGKGKALTESWVDAGIAAARTVVDEVGLDNIAEITWDTPDGRQLIGVEGHGTSSDMFVTTKDGKRIGISLKKDGKVFLANKGYGQEHENMEEGLRKAGASPEAIKKFNDETSPERYNKELVSASKETADEISNDKASVNEIVEMMNGDMEELKKKLDQNNEKGVLKYQKKLGGPPVTEESVKAFLAKTKGQTGTGDHIKALGKVTKNLSNKDHYRKLKSQDYDATRRLLSMMEDPVVKDAMKENIIHGMHAESILGIDDNPNLDKFMTVYGIQPDGAQMNEETMTGLIPELGGDKGLMESISEEFRGAKSPEEKKQVRKKIMDAFKKNIEVDMKEGASEGTINIVHKNPDGSTSKFPIFQTRMRSRPIGAAPVLEINQTNFMANALSRDEDGKQLGTDLDRWPPKKRKNYYDSERKSLEKELKAAQKDGEDLEAEEIQAEIKNLNDKIGKIKEGYESLEGMISRMKRS